MRKIIFRESEKNRSNTTNRWLGWLSLCVMVLMGSTGLAQTIQLGSGTATNSYLPMYYLYDKNYTQTIYTSAEIVAAGAEPTGGTITKIRYKPTASVSTVDWRDWVIYMGNTTKTGYTGTSDWVPVAGLTQVFSSQVPNNVVANTWMEITLATPFVWDGTNIVIAIAENTPGWSGSPNWAAYTLAPTTGSKAIYKFQDGANINPSSPPEATSVTNVAAQIQFDGSLMSACTGTPNAGTAVLTPAGGNSGAPFMANATGVTSASGLAFQWQKFVGGAWQNIAGATSKNSQITAETGAVGSTTDYRVQVTCTASGLSAFSTPATYTIQLVYCTPLYSSGCNIGARVNNVITSNAITNINNTNTQCGSTTAPIGYSNYYDTHQMSAGRGTAFDIQVGVSNYAGGVKVWIDYNQNGTFEANELVTASAATIGVGASHLASITIPQTALVGETRMRVRVVESSTNFDACSSYSYGEAEDYKIEILQLSNCTGTPTAGTVTTPINVCAGTSFTLTTTGATAPADGLLGIWQSSPAGMNTWTDVAGAISTTHTMNSGVLTNTDFRYQMTCTYSTETAISGIVQVIMNPGTDCYCTPTYTTGCTSGDRISNVTLQGESVTLDNTSQCSPAAYGDFTGLASPDLAPGNTYTISISTDYSSPTFEQVKAWIDFDKNGVFSDNEIIANTNNAGLIGGTTEFTFTVPTGLTAGDYRLRVRLVYGSAPIFDACNAVSGYGETEDYTVEMIQLNDCVGTPNAGTTTSPIYACANESFMLSTLGATAPADGLTGIWQSSAAGMNIWTDIAGATSVNYNISGGVGSNTDFRYKMTCSYSNETDISDTISVIMNAAIDCYCIPTGISTTNYITDFSTTGGTDNISNLENSLSADGYGDFFLFHNVTQEVGDSVAFEVKAFGTATSGFRIWVDWNQNGSFDDPGELAYASTGYLNLHTGSFMVPNDALAGQTRMRIGNSSTPNTGPATPCMTNLNGEYEDYMFTVVIPTCAKPFALELDAVSINSATISWTSTGTLFDVELGEEGFFQSGVPTASGIANPYTTTPLSPSTTYEIYVRQDCGSGSLSDWAGPFKFTTECLPPNITGTTPGAVCGEGEVTLSATSDAGTIAWYADETGGPKLSEGASFTTPSLTATTSYWASAFVGGGMENVGPVNPTIGLGGYSTLNTYVTFFTVTSATSITSVDVFANPTSMGSAGAIKITDMSDNSTVGTYPYTVTQAGSLTEGQTILIDQALSAGNYKMEMVGTTVSLYRNTAGAAFPYTSSTVNLTGQSFAGYPEYYYFFYNWVIGSECSSARTEVVATVTSAPDFALAETTVEICEGETSDAVTIATGAADYDTYVWTPSTGVSGNATTGWSFNPTETTTYVLSASQSAGAECISNFDVQVIVNPLPTAITVVASETEVCEDTVIALSVTGNINNGTAVLGNGTTAPSATSYPNPFSAFYGGTKHQMLYTAAELTAQGMMAGNVISAVTFDFATVTGGACVDFTIRMGATTATVMTGFVTGTTTVYGPTTFTPATAGVGLESFTLTTPYVWDGVSNLIVETIHNAGNGGNTSGTTTKTTTTTANSVASIRADNVAGGIAGFDALTTTPTFSMLRPNMTFAYTLEQTDITWSPVANLYTDAAATTAYVANDFATAVYFKSSTVGTVTYTATSHTDEGCSVSDDIDLTVTTAPVIEQNVTPYEACDDGTGLAEFDLTSKEGEILGTQTYNLIFYTTQANAESNTNPIILPTAYISGNATIWVSAGGAGCSSITSFDLVLIETPDAPVVPSPQILFVGQTLADLIVIGDGDLTWYADAALTIQVPETTVMYTEGIFIYYVTASNGGCTSGAAEVIIEVALSTKDFDTTSFKAYPNPVKDYFNISYSKDIQNIAVINMLGQTIFTKTVNASDTQIDMTSLPTGAYFVKVNVDGAVKTIKVVKQ